MILQKEWVLVFVPYLAIFVVSSLMLVYFTRPRIREYFKGPGNS